MSLNRFRKLRKGLVGLRRFWLRRVWKLDIDPTVEMSFSAKFDLTHPQGIHIGPYTYIALNSYIPGHST